MRAPDGAEVTVVIPTKNRLDLVTRSVYSALAQTGVGVRVVLVDDGSDPATARALDDLAGPSVRVMHHVTSLGVSRARNAGLALADSPWVAFLDDDDFWAPDKVSSQVRALADAPGARWSCVGAVHVDENLHPLFWQPPPQPEDALQILSRTGGIPGGGSGVLVSTALARQVGGFDPAFSILADWDFYYRLALASPVASVNRPLVGYFRHPDSMFHDPERLGRELLGLDEKYRTGSTPMRIDYAGWAIQLLLMAVRRRDVGLLSQTLGGAVVRRSRKRSLLRAAVGRVRQGGEPERRTCPPVWAAESLHWLKSPASECRA